MAALITFMNGTIGRLLRIVLGLVLVWLGFLGPLAGSTAGIIVGVIGILPIIMGIWGRCLLQFLPGASRA